jgi:hypothetical protein
MRSPYRGYPDSFGKINFYPLIRIRLARRHGPPSRFFEAMVDSGAVDCMFPEAVATAIGIGMESGKREGRNGIGGAQDVWVHAVQLYVGPEIVNIQAAFARTLPIAGLLG